MAAVKLCGCGCGQSIVAYDSRNRPRSFVPGHHCKLRDYSMIDHSHLKQYSFKKGHVPFNKNKVHLPGPLNPFYGKHHSLETRTKMKGPRNGNWRGGNSRVSDLIRKSKEYLDWKAQVFIRDGRTCVLCGSIQNIEADHIKSFSEYPELRFDVNNGRTLCHDCHSRTDNYGMRGKKKERISISPMQAGA